MATKKGGLGKGLSALFSDSEVNVPVENLEDYQIVDIDISLLDRNLKQPRKSFDDDKLKELASSISTYGVLQPLILAKQGERYLIIAGERRYRASLIAGKKTVPAILKEYTPEQIQEISLIENLHREDLNAIEAAEGMRELMDNHGLTQEEVAQRIGKSRPYVTNTLRLLQLPKEVLDLVRSGELSPGHARTLISIDNKAFLIELAKRAVQSGMSVRELEQHVRMYFTRKDIPVGPNKNQEVTLEMKEFVSDLKRLFATKVKIKGNRNKGRITIDYFSADDLDRIYSLVHAMKEKSEM